MHNNWVASFLSEKRVGVALLLKIIVGILATIGAVVVLGIMLVLVLYFVIVRRVTKRVRQSLRQFEELNGGSIDADSFRNLEYGSQFLVPPMRIHVVHASEEIWGDESGVEAGAEWIKAHGFKLVSDFLIEELPESRLKVFLSDDKLLVATIRQDDEATSPYVEFCFDLGDNRRGGVSNPPCTTLPLPEGAIGEHFYEDFVEDIDVLEGMLQRARELVQTNAVLKVTSNKIVEFFEAAHAAEMDMRIERGGLTGEEIRAALGREDDTVSDADIEVIQWDWQVAIEEFLLEHSLQGVEASGELLAVYNGSMAVYLRERICDFYETENDLEPGQVKRIKDELDTLLRLFSPREAIARLRPLLPESLRFSLVDQLRKPVEADLYLLPFSE